MADLLLYRIPNKEIVEKTGNFHEASEQPATNTFCISTSDKSTLYFFQEQEGTPEGRLHFLDKSPYSVSKKEYLMGAEALLNNFHNYELKKAVYARVKSVSFDERKCRDFFLELCVSYPNAFVYLVSSSLFGTWIGATPEVLLSMHGQQGYTMSLAGTKKVQLQDTWSEKELEEQALVTEYIQNRLLVQDLHEIEQHGPFDIDAGPVRHLRTDFSFYSSTKSGLEIAKDLHPTPAVAGVPTQKAQELVSTVEPFDRNLYTGFIGALSANNTFLYVNLRCCQIQAGKAYLYVGGGYTVQSIPENEWEETENKAKTLLDIIDKIDPR